MATIIKRGRRYLPRACALVFGLDVLTATDTSKIVCALWPGGTQNYRPHVMF
eukprot:COSAG02_NODE_14560_length_1259_cov_27.642241_1_plen_52_part_00